MTSPATFIDQAQVAARIAELGRQLRQDHGDEPIHLIAVLKGAFVFLADLVRQIDGPVTLDFIAVSSYGSGTTSSGEVRMLKDVD